VTTPQYAQALRAAPEFFRRQAEGRYSDTTIMNLSRTWDLFNENQSAPELPTVFIAEVPFSYDEETEVKRGGTVGMLVIFADKSLLAVARTARRRGVANDDLEPGRLLRVHQPYGVLDRSPEHGRTRVLPHPRDVPDCNERTGCRALQPDGDIR
jgi:hypothetical protein